MSLISGLVGAVTGSAKEVARVVTLNRKSVVLQAANKAGKATGVQNASKKALARVAKAGKAVGDTSPTARKVATVAASGMRSMDIKGATSAGTFLGGMGKVNVAAKGGTMIGGSLLRGLAKTFSRAPVKKAATAAKVTKTAAKKAGAARVAAAPKSTATKSAVATATAKKTTASKNASLRQAAQIAKARTAAVKTAQATAKARIAQAAAKTKMAASSARTVARKATSSARTVAAKAVQRSAVAAPAIRGALAPSISGVKGLAKLTAVGAGLAGGVVAAQAISARQQAAAREEDINEAIQGFIDGGDPRGDLSEILDSEGYEDDDGVYYPGEGDYAMYEPNDPESFDCGVDWINDSIASGGLVAFDGDEPLGIVDPETGEITGFSDEESEAVKAAVRKSPYALALAGALLVTGGLYVVSDRFRNWIKSLVPGKKKNKWGMW